MTIVSGWATVANVWVKINRAIWAIPASLTGSWRIVTLITIPMKSQPHFTIGTTAKSPFQNIPGKQEGQSLRLDTKSKTIDPTLSH